VRFGDFLKATVLLSGASATLLAALTVIGLTRRLEETPVYVCAVWWVLATVIGSALGARDGATAQIARLLATARAQHSLPDLHPARTIFNRLWPLLACTLGAGALSVFAPQIGGIAAGFAIIWALAWRRQEAAVAAIEERDGARFYVDKTSPLSAIRLIRTPGFGEDFLVSPSGHR
jgi:hypothetical protein